MYRLNLSLDSIIEGLRNFSPVSSGRPISISRSTYNRLSLAFCNSVRNSTKHRNRIISLAVSTTGTGKCNIGANGNTLHSSGYEQDIDIPRQSLCHCSIIYMIPVTVHCSFKAYFSNISVTSFLEKFSIYIGIDKNQERLVPGSAGTNKRACYFKSSAVMVIVRPAKHRSNTIKDASQNIKRIFIR